MAPIIIPQRKEPPMPSETDKSATQQPFSLAPQHDEREAAGRGGTMNDERDKTPLKAYKGFSRDMKCRDFQYKEGEAYETDRAQCCRAGFHACEYPLDCFSYYGPGESVYHEVEVDGGIDKSDDDTKVAATKIKIGARLDIAGLSKAAIDFVLSHVKPGATADEDNGLASEKGYKSAASATGESTTVEIEPLSLRLPLLTGFHGMTTTIFNFSILSYSSDLCKFPAHPHHPAIGRTCVSRVPAQSGTTPCDQSSSQDSPARYSPPATGLL